MVVNEWMRGAAKVAGEHDRKDASFAALPVLGSGSANPSRRHATDAPRLKPRIIRPFLAIPADIAISDSDKSRTAKSCLGSPISWPRSHWCGRQKPIEIRNAREEWLTERSNSAAICCNDTFPLRSDSNLSQIRFTCHGTRPAQIDAFRGLQGLESVEEISHTFPGRRHEQDW
jgi:hypothetical protein